MAEVCIQLLGDVSARVEDTIRLCGEKQVHDLRVAIRRFNQALHTFEAGLPAHSIKTISKRLKKTMRLAGRVRNVDVAMQYAKKWRLTGQANLREQREDAARELSNTLAKWDDPGYTAAATDHAQTLPVQDHARELLSAMAAGFFARGNEAAAPKATIRQMHGFRIAAKKFRYTMELFAPAYGPVLDARIEQLRALQTLLGGINDCATVEGILSGSAAASRLRKRQRRMTAEFRTHWQSQFSGAAIVREWVEALSLLSVRKGPQREHSYRRRLDMTARDFGQERRRRMTGGV